MQARIWIDEQWDESPLPLGVANRLRKADKSIQAIEVIHHILHKDYTAKVGNEDAAEGLSLSEIEGLLIAMDGLIATADEMMEEVREPDHACHDTRPQNAKNAAERAA